MSLQTTLSFFNNITLANWGGVYALRREPLYHKLQYSKVPSFDAAAATLGVVLGALVVYLSLNGFGSMGVDLSDLTTLVWYCGLWYTIFSSLSWWVCGSIGTLAAIILSVLTLICEMVLAIFFEVSFLALSLVVAARV